LALYVDRCLDGWEGIKVGRTSMVAKDFR